MIDEKRLIELGYTRTESTDKDSFDDMFDTLKFVDYEKEITEGFSIEICFAYHAEKENDWSLIEISANLEHAGESIPIPKDIEKIEQVYNLLKPKV